LWRSFIVSVVNDGMFVATIDSHTLIK